MTLVHTFKNNNNLGGQLDPLIWQDGIFGTPAFIAGLLAMPWNLRAVCVASGAGRREAGV